MTPLEQAVVVALGASDLKGAVLSPGAVTDAVRIARDAIEQYRVATNGPELGWKIVGAIVRGALLVYAIDTTGSPRELCDLARAMTENRFSVRAPGA